MPLLHVSEIKLFQNYFSFRRRPPEKFLFHRAETCLKLFHRLTAAHECFVIDSVRKYTHLNVFIELHNTVLYCLPRVNRRIQN